MNPDAIGHVDEREAYRGFVCDQLGLDSTMDARAYALELDARIHATPPTEKPSASGKPRGRVPKYIWNGVPIRNVMTPAQANTVRWRVRQLGHSMADAIAWAEEFYGAFDWDSAHKQIREAG